MFKEAIPTIDLWCTLLGRDVECVCLEDNQATITVVKKGFSPKLRHILRTQKVNLGSIKEVFDDGIAKIEYCNTAFQAADIFTKALAPALWSNALAMLGIDTGSEPAIATGEASD